ncbi:aspartic proteinase CDR1-like [Cornus florida]|uniref:aspartic proteinase CDR1-like n=1 Tax=Cornus florida TaxID=4283 RepID=UPI00289A8B77|nr:aspartic proteinase CDR1-like [Cornus florida]
MAATTLFNLSALLYATFFVSYIINLSVVEASNGGGGFTVDLIHRDSRLSPFYNPSDTRFDRLRKAFTRSTLRAVHFSPTSKSEDTIQSQIIATSGEYLMNLSMGTPPVNMIGIADTGSDLLWTQCQPCSDCFQQDAPMFNPKDSSTYQPLTCDSQPCEALDTHTCNSDVCQYKMSYGDQSYSNGDLAVETFIFGSTSGHPVSVPKVVFGCGRENQGTFNESTSGIIGLGGGPLSIVNQLGDNIKGLFSYCLVPLNAASSVTSEINFGTNAIVSGSGVVSTPLVSKTPQTYYHLTLEGVTVGNSTLPYKSSSESKAGADEGNIIIDSGTTLTYLPQDFYSDLASALAAAIQATAQDSVAPFGLCYATQGDGFDAPTVTFHFAGADVDLPASSTFIEVSDGVVCLAIVPADSVAIFGNLSQMNLLVGYDLVNKKVSFKPTDCTKV